MRGDKRQGTRDKRGDTGATGARLLREGGGDGGGGVKKARCGGNGPCEGGRNYLEGVSGAGRTASMTGVAMQMEA